MKRGQKVSLSDHVIRRLLAHHYGLTVHSIHRVLDIPKVVTDRGTFGFKNAVELPDLSFIHHSIKQIKNHYPYIPGIVPLLSGDVLLSFEDEIYYLEEWMDAEDVLFADDYLGEEIGAAIARFHAAAKGLVPDKKSFRFEWGNRRKKLRKVYKKIQDWKKNHYDLPEFLYERNILDFLEARCSLAYQYIENVSYSTLWEDNPDCAVLCHGSLHQRNILIDGKRNIYFIDIESLSYAERVYDLASFIHYFAPYKGWNPLFIYRFIRGYQQNLTRPLSLDEWRCFFSYLAFPRRLYSWMHRHFDKSYEMEPEETYFKLLGIIIHDQPKDMFLKQFHPVTLPATIELAKELSKG
ncbi:phosphotransferase [Fictibacillus gelatini]|uniref:phosphotransferase n=1 Tax=Fictibacillus gelatini TaxID=225985 RepID=UPI0004140DD2|nr:phosphotransferase [Fictibacillus gelatini]